MENRIEEYHKKLFEAQEATVRIRHNDWTEEQIQERCQELRNEILTKESGWRNERLKKIWATKLHLG